MNKRKIMSIVAMSCGAIIFLMGLIFLFKTMSFGDVVSAEDNYTVYAERDFEEKILGHGSLFTCLILIGLTTFFSGLYVLLSKEFDKKYIHLSMMLIGAISAFEGASYGLSYASKVEKYVSRIDVTGTTEDVASQGIKAYNKIMSYDSPWLYIIWAVMGAVLLGYAISKFVENKKIEQ